MKSVIGLGLVGLAWIAVSNLPNASTPSQCVTFRPIHSPNSDTLLRASEDLRLIDEERFEVIQSLESAQLTLGEWEFTAESLLELSLLETMDLERALEIFRQRNQIVKEMLSWFRQERQDYSSLHRRLASRGGETGVFKAALENVCEMVLVRAGVDEPSLACEETEGVSTQGVFQHFNSIRNQFLRELTQLNVYLNFGQSIVQTHLEGKTLAQRSYQSLFESTPMQDCPSFIQ